VLLDPSVDNFVSLGVTDGDAKRYDDGAVAFAQAIGRARAAVIAKPTDAKAIRKLSWAYLYEGRLFVKAGATSKARAAFAQTAAWAAKLPKKDTRYAMYLEEAQEATVALDNRATARKDGALARAVDRSRSARLGLEHVQVPLGGGGTPGKSVALAASGLPKRWVASFCSDRECAPFRTTVALPASGVKVIEFQVIPQSPSTTPPTVRVDGDGASASVRVAATR